jgi:hypothetical protein
MKDLKQLLTDADPVTRELGLSSIDAHAMRRSIVAAAAAANEPKVSPAWWPGPFVMAAAIAACLVVGVSIGVRLDREPRSVAQKPSTAAGPQGARRQLQFVTTGGTRIIWTFHEDFEL